MTIFDRIIKDRFREGDQTVCNRRICHTASLQHCSSSISVIACNYLFGAVAVQLTKALFIIF